MSKATSILVATALLAVAACNDAPPSASTPKLTVPGEPVPTAFADGFDTAPTGWEPVAGTWERRAAANGWVLAQTATNEDFPVALLTGRTHADVDVAVRFRPVSGQVDASGGIVVRARDARNFYVVRANALEDNFRLYTVIDGHREQIASTTIDPPTLGTWHALRVVAVGPRIQAYLDGRLLIDHRDTTFAQGRIGLWTKADSVTEFDDLEVKGPPVPPAR